MSPPPHYLEEVYAYGRTPMAVVQPGMHQGNYQLLECGGRYISADLTQLTRIGEATRHRFLDMHPHTVKIRGHMITHRTPFSPRTID